MARRTVNCLLLRYDGGHVYIDRSGSDLRSERYVEMKGFRDRDHAIAVGEQILDNAADGRLRVTQSGPVRSSFQVPGSNFRLGDAFDGDIVTSFTITQDNDGNLTVTPELLSSFEAKGAAMDRRLARAAAGVTGENAAPVIDRQETGSSIDSTPPEWSQSSVEVATSPAWTATRPYWLSWLEVTVEGGAATTVVVGRRRKGTSAWHDLGSATVSSSNERVVTKIHEGFRVGDQMRMSTILAGSGAANLSASPRGAMV